MPKPFKGKKIVAENDVWELIEGSKVFKRFVEFCLSRFFENGNAADAYPVPDDIEDVFSDKLYFIRDDKDDCVRISLTGDGTGEKMY